MAARSRTDSLLARVAHAEACLVEAAATARASSWRMDQQLGQAAERAAAHQADAREAAAAAAAEASRWRAASEGLGRQLADEKEECSKLKARLQVRVSEKSAQNGICVLPAGSQEGPGNKRTQPRQTAQRKRYEICA